MSKISKKEWKKFFSNNGYINWKIDTSITTYIDNSVGNWIPNINDTNKKIYIFNRNNKKYQAFLGKERQGILFYRSKDNLYAHSVYRQIIDVLYSTRIVSKKSDDYYVSDQFITFLNSKTSKDNSWLIYQFIRENLGSLLEEYIIKPLESFENYQSDSDADYKKNEDLQVTKYWFNVLLRVDKNYLSRYFIKCWDIEPKGADFDKFVSNIVGEDGSQESNQVLEMFRNIIDKIANITNVANIMWELQEINDLVDFKIPNLNSEYSNPFLDKLDDATTTIKELSEILSFKDIIQSQIALRYQIPIFQRSYSWDEYIINGLFQNILIDSKNARQGHDQTTFLNTIILMSINYKYNIIDGQQRIVSLLLIYLMLLRKAMSLNQEEAKKVLLSDNGHNNIEIIKKMLEDFKSQCPEHYTQLYNLFFNVKEVDRSTRFYENYNKIVRNFDKEITKDNIKSICKYFLDNVKINIVSIQEYNRGDLTKIFQNINQYSKRLGVLDLLRNLIFQHTTNRVNINEFNKTVNIYFRKSNKLDNDEDIKKIVTFIDAWLVKEGEADKIEEINSNYYDITTRTFEKFKIFTSHNSNARNIIYELWKEFVYYEYAFTGCVEKIENIIKSNLTVFKHECVEFKNFVDDFIKKIKYINFINLQINNITSGGSKSIYVPLIISILSKLNFFPNVDLNEENLIILSKVLYKIEKFDTLWELDFKGQSLGTSIINKTNKLLFKDNKPVDVEFVNLIYKELIKMLSLNDEDDKNIKLLREHLNNKFNYEITDENSSFKPVSNKLYKLIIARVFSGFKNMREQPFWYEKFRSEDERQNDLSYLNLSYEHILPQKPSPEDRKDLKNMNIDFNTDYMTLVYKIGNGDLMFKPDNSRLSNEMVKDPSKYNMVSKTNFALNTPIMSLLPDKEGNFTKISFSPIVGEPIKCLEDFKNRKKSIDERTNQIIEAYIYIMFSDKANKLK
ncbi:DUF262 domain-containing protein [Mycoplasma sp. 125]|uniref:DUF262 domain-containing protein n=1 Tax=Mycoplasma sp. 125 TaxID=3447505 RepID=UPI003F6554B6